MEPATSASRSMRSSAIRRASSPPAAPSRRTSKSHPARRKDHAAIASLGAVGSVEGQPALLKALGQLWQAGIEPDWTGFYEKEQRRRVKLPTYPFERERCWVDPPSRKIAEPEPIVMAPVAQPNVHLTVARSEPERLVSMQLEIISKQLKVLQRKR